MDPSLVKWTVVCIQLVLVVGAFGLTIYLHVQLSTLATISPDFVDTLFDLIDQRQYVDAFSLARRQNSFLGRTLCAGLNRLQYGYEEGRQAALRAADSIQHDFRSFVNYMPAFAAVSTMVGFLNSQGGDPSAVMDLPGLIGIALAVFLAVPCVFGHVLYTNWLTRLDLDNRSIADDLLVRIFHSVTKK